jgi:multiple sugar transport system substrate-binding protein
MITPEAQNIGMTKVPAATIVRLPVNSSVNAATVHNNDARWTLAQQIYQDQAHYEPVSMPNWAALRQASSDALNSLIAKCGDPQAALKTLNDKFGSLLKQQGVAAG